MQVDLELMATQAKMALQEQKVHPVLLARLVPMETTVQKAILVPHQSSNHHNLEMPDQLVLTVALAALANRVLKAMTVPQVRPVPKAILARLEVQALTAVQATRAQRAPMVLEEILAYVLNIVPKMVGFSSRMAHENE